MHFFQNMILLLLSHMYVKVGKHSRLWTKKYEVVISTVKGKKVSLLFHKVLLVNIDWSQQSWSLKWKKIQP